MKHLRKHVDPYIDAGTTDHQFFLATGGETANTQFRVALPDKPSVVSPIPSPTT